MSTLFRSGNGDDSGGRPSPARVFIEFKYPEIKDLLKHFLTLISGALVFSVTFSEKIVGLDGALAGQKKLLLGAWFLLILALGACGLGVYILYLAEAAKRGHVLTLDRNTHG